MRRSTTPPSSVRRTSWACPRHERAQSAQQPGLLAMRAPTPRVRRPAPAASPGGPLPFRVRAPRPRRRHRQRRGGACRRAACAEEQPPKAVSLMPTRETLNKALGSGTSGLPARRRRGRGDRPQREEMEICVLLQPRQAADSPALARRARVPEAGSDRQPLRRQGALQRCSACRSCPTARCADVHLEKARACDFLDDVAVEAVREAQPFPNPPQQLVDPASARSASSSGSWSISRVRRGCECFVIHRCNRGYAIAGR
jgi:hypothetical protein